MWTDQIKCKNSAWDWERRESLNQLGSSCQGGKGCGGGWESGCIGGWPSVVFRSHSTKKSLSVGKNTSSVQASPLQGRESHVNRRMGGK